MAYSQNDYSTQWAAVEKLEAQSLPQSALAEVDKIYSMAIKDKNSPQVIKSLIYQLKYTTAIDQDVFPDRLAAIEAYTAASKDVAEQSVLYALMAQLYNQYYSSQRNKINQRTAVTDYLLDDIREWPANAFIKKIIDYVLLSVKPAELLQGEPATDYAAILTEGETSRKLRPTLYDLLMNEGIATLNTLNVDYNTRNYYTQTQLEHQTYFAPAEVFINLRIYTEDYNLPRIILKMYQDLLSFRVNVPRIFYTPRNPNAPGQGGAVDYRDEAQLMVDLDRLLFVKDNTTLYQSGDNYIQALETLREQYQDNDFCVEIIYRMAAYYTQGQGRNNSYDEYDIYGRPSGSTDYTGLKKAYELLRVGIERYPHYERIGLLTNMLNDITTGSLNVNSDNTVYPGDDLKLNIHYKNQSKITVEIYKINAPVTEYANAWNRYGLYGSKGTLVEKKEIALINEFPYQEYDTIVHIPMKELGNYEYLIYGDNKTNNANQQFSVSRLLGLSRSLAEARGFLVVDRKTGNPIEGAEVKLYSSKNNNKTLVETRKTDKLGLCEVSGVNDKYNFYTVSYKDDADLMFSSTPWVSGSSTTSSVQKRMNLFTDRSIYRPGQTVYVKAIVWKTTQEEPQVLANEKVTLIFRDANYKEIAKKTFTSNEFGSVSGEFIIPRGLLNGNFTIRSEELGVSTSIQVEEYKRPTFDIKFLPNDETYTFGDKVTVKGEAKTFSGVNLQDTEVSYTVTRQPHWLYRFYGRPSQQVANGTVRTQDDGSFVFDFTPEKAYEDRNSKTAYTYVIEATVTSGSGETQSSATRINVGDTSMVLAFSNINDNYIETLNALTVSASNLQGTPVKATGSIEVYQLNATEGVVADASMLRWELGSKIYTGSFTANEEIKLSNKKLAPGRYRIIAKANDDKGREVETSQDFTLASVNDKRPPVPVYQWMMDTKTTVAVGEKAEIVYGSAAKNVDVLYELFKDNKKLSASRFKLNNENRKIEIPYLASYGDGITAVFTFIKDEQVFTQNINIYKKQPDKQLALAMETFRDRLLPGQQEEWRLTVKDAGTGKPVSAELLAGMYDASLDKLINHSWYFSPTKNIYLSAPRFNQGTDMGTSSGSFINPYDYYDVPSFSFDSFNWFGFSIYSKMLRGRSDLVYESAADMAAPQSKQVFTGAVAEISADGGAIDEDFAFTQEEAAEEQPTAVRENFNETAFFYPQLKTNANGETVISFTVPESNTTWKFMGLAHTQDLKYGQIMKEAISQKKLMVAPNIPRFMREGDQMSIMVNVSNMSEEKLDCSVGIEFFDPNTGEQTIPVANNLLPITLAPGQTSPMSWWFEVPSGLDMTAVKIVATSETYSDGEQHIIAVLPNRMMVTESLPLNVRGNQTKTFKFDKLINNTSSTLDNYRLTVEMTGNPVWYAVQALPSMQAPQSENVIDWINAYYANNLATSIADSTPKIKQIIEAWNKQGGTKETLISNLETNEELKAVLLEETPWVLEAEDETEQKQRLGLLFDINHNNNLNRTAIDKLRSLQKSDGGWSWFKGMNSSISITQYVLYSLGDLARMDVLPQDNDITDMQTQALRFVDKKFKEYFDEMKKRNTKWRDTQSISGYQLEYLYMRSFYDKTPLNETKEAVDFYTTIIEKHWAKDTNLYKRSLMAMLMQRNGNTKTAQAMVKSLREHAVNKDDLGMYWANNNAYTFIFQSATTVHTFIMDAFNEVGSTGKEMDEMKLWLLKQKQTQVWESTPATASAVGILLRTGNNWLDSQGIVNVSLGNKKVSTEGGEIGTGYIKEVFDGTAITPAMGTITVSKQDAGSAWGGVYWQYFEDLDKITVAKTGLNVEKVFFVEQTTSTGKTLVPITSDSPLKVGDKVIVRLTVRNDRDMEYVMLKDMRAACFEPVEQISGYRWAQGTGYYQSSKDASTNFYFDNLAKGTYVFEYPVYVTAMGDYSTGTATIQCMYAAEFVSHTAGIRIKVEK